MTNATYRMNLQIATATAIVWGLPYLGSLDQQEMQNVAEYHPLDDVSRQIVADAFQPSSYMLGKSSDLFSMISEVASRLLMDSKPLDTDFSQVVDKEFWNLLK